MPSQSGSTSLNQSNTRHSTASAKIRSQSPPTESTNTIDRATPTHPAWTRNLMNARFPPGLCPRRHEAIIAAAIPMIVLLVLLPWKEGNQSRLRDRSPLPLSIIRRNHTRITDPSARAQRPSRNRTILGLDRPRLRTTWRSARTCTHCRGLPQLP
jgi:hypothetical protein